jgi:DNA-binding SARP family transcriptional activator/tetratricopeptide (TPR) repeat protein
MVRPAWPVDPARRCRPCTAAATTRGYHGPMDPALRVLGTPALRRVGRWSPLPLDLRAALLGVLAHGGRPVARERLAVLFWPDSDDRAARQNLRQLVLRARALLGPGLIEGDAASLRVDVTSDMTLLRAALERGDAVAAGELGIAPLLEGLEHLPNPEWQAWLDLERRALEERVRRVLLEAAAAWAHGPSPAGAVGVLAAWVDRDPFDDDLHAAYLRCARHAPGEAAAASARLSRIAALLDREVGSGVTESVVLASTWLGDEEAPIPARAPGVEDAGRAGALPFVGRQVELDALDAAVLDPAVALVTVHGPGGIGKTRLVEAWASRFGNGVQVVAMAGSAGADDAARRIAAAHAWRVADAADARVVADLLGRSVPAVVLDEVEGLPWLAGLLQVLGGVRGLTVVTTSRERIGVEGEHVLRLGGLAWEGEGEASPALRLFRRAAARVRATVDWDEADRRAVARFAARVEGSPLALVVAAGWLQLGPPAAVLETLLDDDDDALSFSEVLEPSWRRLSLAARDALQALSVFPERFEVDAALEVAGCDRRTLRALVDAALVEPGTRDGLRLHPLVRLEAARRLADAPAAEAGARRRHAEHVARTLGDRSRALYRGASQLEVHAAVGARLPDLQVAWTTACDSGAIDLLDRLLDLLWSFEMRGWYRLGEALAASAVEALERAADPRARMPLARALARAGIFAMRRGDAGWTRATARRAAELFAAEGADPDPFVFFHLGIADWFEGDTVGAEHWHRELLALARRTGDVWAEYGALANLGQIAVRRGRRDEGRALLQAAIDLVDPALDRWGAALLHGAVAWELHADGDADADAAIRPHIEVAIEAAAQLGMRHHEALALVLLHHHLRRVGDPDRASAVLERARALVQAGALAELDPRDVELRLVRETLAAHPATVTEGVTPTSRPDA